MVMEHNLKQSNSNHFDQVLCLLAKVARNSEGADYIFRGEPRCYEKVSSSLYRQYQEIEGEHFEIAIVQREILEQAKKYTQQTDEMEILTEIQHYGGKTNLIDFTTDAYIALFFACDGHARENGRVILLKRTKKINECINIPLNPTNRVLAQKSVFVQPPTGHIEESEMTVVDVPHWLKQPILEYLRTRHGISSETIYNDLHGFIRFQDLHQSAYAAFFVGATHNNKGELREAIESLTKSIELNPQLSESYNNRGIAYARLPDVERAINDFTKALELDPRNALAHNNLGNVYNRAGEPRNAIQCYIRALDLGFNNGGVYFNIGITWLRLSEWENARKNLRFAQIKGLDVPDSFRSIYTSINNFERKMSIELPRDIADMLNSTSN